MPPKKRVSKRSTLDIDRSVGNLVRAHRIERGMSQEALGNQLGVTFQQVQKYERGVNRMGIGRVIQMAALFKVTVHDLIGQGNVAPISQSISANSFKLAEEFNDLPPEVATLLRHLIASIKASLKKK